MNINVQKPAAQRKAAERARRRKQGLAPLEVWARPEHHAQIKALAASLAKHPGDKITPGLAHGGAQLVPD